jgi:two-component system, cell cycle sensor histidine kinase and response regulator CckA
VTHSLPLRAITVLVVDDERLARSIAFRILSEEGCRVMEADGRDEAVQVLMEAGGRVDLVLLDVVMPRFDGVEVGEIIQTLWPGQRLLFMSAHPAEVLAQHGVKDLDVPFLAKPYTRVELLAKVEEALRRPAPGTAGERRRTDAERE